MGDEGLIFAMVVVFFYQPNVADAFFSGEPNVADTVVFDEPKVAHALTLFWMHVGRISVGGRAYIQGRSASDASSACLRCE